MTPIKSIRAKCLDCCLGQAHEVKLCTASTCPLHPYRFGKNPNKSCERKLTDEQKAELVERLRLARESLKKPREK